MSCDPTVCTEHFHHPDLGVQTMGVDGPHWIWLVLFTLGLGVLFIQAVMS